MDFSDLTPSPRTPAEQTAVETLDTLRKIEGHLAVIASCVGKYGQREIHEPMIRVMEQFPRG